VLPKAYSPNSALPYETARRVRTLILARVLVNVVVLASGKQEAHAPDRRFRAVRAMKREKARD
jgi:hypothetical protein